MVFFIDDILLRTIGLSIPPFDMIWFLETLEEYARGQLEEETKKDAIKILKENRLLYELREITYEEYKNKNNEIKKRISDIEKVNRLNLKQRINNLE